MSQHDEFLEPRCSPSTLDIYTNRLEIVQALREQLPHFTGTVLDMGCGYMPYKPLLLAPPSRAEKYIGLDLQDNLYQKPDLEWDGRTIPLAEASIDCVMATEVFEHCPDVEAVLREVFRVLKPGGLLFLTVPFLWPLHNVPYDEYRYTPFALERHLRNAAFTEVHLKALGGWDASLAQMLGLWVRRRPFAPWKRALLSGIAWPIVRLLTRRDDPPRNLRDSCMITGLAGTATKPK
jgi:SAM-dependent methyltransferase